MDSKLQLPSIFTILGLVAYHILFWQQLWGLNTLIFTALVLVFSFMLKPAALQAPGPIISSAVALITAFAIAWHGGLFPRIIWIPALLTAVGFIRQPQLGFVLFALASYLLDLALLAPRLGQDLKQGKPIMPKLGQWRAQRWLPYLLSIVLVFVFLMLYATANEYVERCLTYMMNHIGRFLNYIVEAFSRINFTWPFFMTLGALGLSAAFIYHNYGELLGIELAKRDLLKRIRQSKGNNAFNALNMEYRLAFISLILLNALLLFVNITDITKIWFETGVPSSAQLSRFVHAGTNSLIASILLAIAVLLYFFRSNLNFHPKAKALKLLAQAWMLQNMVIVLSVVARNYHYINYYGLTIKRIGVMIFVLLTLVGLASMVLKLRQNWTPFKLLKFNGMALFIVLSICSVPDWSKHIVHFNFQASRIERVDMPYMINMTSDHVYPLLEQYRPSYSAMHQQDSIGMQRIVLFDNLLQQKEAEYQLKRAAHNTWQSMFLGRY